MAESSRESSSFVLKGDEVRELPVGAVVLRYDPEKEIIRKKFNREAKKSWHVSSHGLNEVRADLYREVTSEGNEASGGLYDVITFSNGIERRLTLRPKWQSVTFLFKVENLRDIESLSFHANYETFCEKSRTSWLCEMFFKKAEVNLRTPCVVFRLKRTDFASDARSVTITMSVRDVTLRPKFGWRDVQEVTLNSNEVIWQDFVGDFPIPEEASYFNMKLLVNVDITIYPCEEPAIDPDRDDTRS